MRAALGEPGFEYRETIASAAVAAAAGGITTLAALPDTQPAIDDPALVQLLRTRGEETGSLTILPYGAVTRGCRGEELAELGLLREAGAVAFTDGSPRHRVDQADAAGFVVCPRLRRPDRAASGRSVAGGRRICARRGSRPRAWVCPAFPPRPRRSWSRATSGLRRLTGGAVHFAHVSTGDALDLIRRAKDDGTRGDLRHGTALFRFERNDRSAISEPMPSCRRRCARKHDRQAVVAGLADGTIDAIASDHQPRDADDKRLPFALAAAGGCGLATLLAVTLAHVHNGSLPMARPSRC